MRRLIYITTVLFLGLTSCTKIIDVDLNDDENKRLSVDANFSTLAKEHEVKLSITANYFSADAPERVSGASVSVTDGITTIDYLEVEPGIYRTAPTAAAIPNREYTLNISYNGEVYSATDFCDSVPNLDSVKIEPVFDPNNGSFDYYSIQISTQEKAGFGDYYAWQIYINGKLDNDTITEQISTDDAFFPDGTYFDLFELTRMSEDDLEPGDTIEIAQFAISEETYDAYIAILLQTEFRGGIFDTPPADVPTNLTNDAVGLFSVSGESRKVGYVP